VTIQFKQSVSGPHPKIEDKTNGQGVPLMTKIRKSFTHGRTKQAVMDRKRVLKPATSPVQTKTTIPQLSQADIDAMINSPEFIEESRKQEEKQKRAEERRLA
jgi:hypothetical protein